MAIFFSMGFPFLKITEYWNDWLGCIFYSPGSRGLKFEVWNNSKPNTLADVLAYDGNRTGYWQGWTDSMPHTLPQEMEYFVERLRGFFVPTDTNDYTFYIRGDDRCELYFSLTGDPKDKVRQTQQSNCLCFSCQTGDFTSWLHSQVKIAYNNRYSPTYSKDVTQKSDLLALEKGKAWVNPFLPSRKRNQLFIVGYCVSLAWRCHTHNSSQNMSLRTLRWAVTMGRVSTELVKKMPLRSIG